VQQACSVFKRGSGRVCVHVTDACSGIARAFRDKGKNPLNFCQPQKKKFFFATYERK